MEENDSSQNNKNEPKSDEDTKLQDITSATPDANVEADVTEMDSDEELSALMNIATLEDSSEGKAPSTITGTGLIYDEVFLKHECEFDEGYPECPDRARVCYERCCQLGLVDRCIRIPVRYATEDHILLQHSRELLDKALSTTSYSIQQQKELSEKYDSFYANKETYECTLAACGSTIEAVEQIITQKIKNSMVISRPPGHHAMENEFCGYCMFNNVAIATKFALEEYKIPRILIVDLDVHHGQGTQYMFYDDPRVLYFSIHRYEYGSFWPNLRESDYDFIGRGNGKGFNVNVPLNKTGMTDSEYIAILQQVLMPIAYEFSPLLTLVSCGYDAALGCPEGEMEVTPAAYAHFINMLGAVSSGRVCAVLEGGYCLKSLAEGCALSLRALLGDPCPLLKPTQEPSDNVTESILNVIKVLKPYWNCFFNQDILEDGEICQYDALLELPPKPDIEFATNENRPEKYDIMGSEFFPSQTKERQQMYDQRLNNLIAEVSLNKAAHRTCLVFDADMRAHKNLFMSSHPERPDRISSIYNLHVEWKLLKRCLQVQSRLATEEELLTIHSQDYLDDIKSTPKMGDFALRDKGQEYNSIYLCTKSYECALLSAGSVLNVVDTVLSGQAQNGVAINRPPGHHAERDTCMGFCFFNNVAIAAKYAQNKYGVKRVLILDWDVHHGNGTQNQFYNDPSVLFISLHKFDNGWFYPVAPDGGHDFIGSGDGEGYNINIPWNHNAMGNSEYISAFLQIVMPVAYEFAPELVLVSAGFDSARGDPLGGYDVLPSGYGHMTHMLSQLANGKVVVLLEGGYNLNSISVSMATCTSVLLGDQCPLVSRPKPCDSAMKTIHEVIDAQKKYWKSLKFQVSVPDIEVQQITSKTEKLNVQDLHTTNSMSNETQLNGLNAAETSEAKVAETAEAKAVETSKANIGEIAEAKASDDELLGACGGSEAPRTVMDVLKLPGVDRMYAVQPIPWCPHLEQVEPLNGRRLDCRAPCLDCDETDENWICLVCYKVYCSRFKNEHMLYHGLESEHRIVLSYSDLSVWCYACDNYIDNEITYPMKNSAHRSKFGEDLPC
ncbi:histone deacetylase 6 isoform X1 [Patella vulgata]|uniref:histone deacetylase 6 isoform X1 n=2 Tax=Patella vulgata TaxID=6465 RepID=UPI0024A993D6|nr:histone deacetylase 6 isoform X1 [Patella vulgata]